MRGTALRSAFLHKQQHAVDFQFRDDDVDHHEEYNVVVIDRTRCSGRRCDYCCHDIPAAPIPGVVKRADFKRGGARYYTSGRYCSWGCVVSGAKCTGVDMFHVWSYVHRSTKLRVLPVAPPRHSLRAFGGQLTIEEFRGKCDAVDMMQLPRCVPMRRRVYEQLRTTPGTTPSKARNDGSAGDTCPTEAAAPAYVLSRSKPLQKDRNIMDRLGFVVKR